MVLTVLETGSQVFPGTKYINLILVKPHMDKNHPKAASGIKKHASKTVYKSDTSSRELYDKVPDGSSSEEAEIFNNNSGISTENRRILIVEDEMIVRNSTFMLLRELGYHVQSCADGERALLLVAKAFEEQNQFDVVLIDLTIKGEISGQNILKRLKEVDPSIKAILFTGHINNRVMLRYKEYGFKALLSKPYTITELESVLLQVIGS